MPVSETDRRNVGLVDIVAGRTREVPVLTDPMLLDLHLPSTLENRVASELTHVGGGKLVDLSGAAVLFEQVRLGEVELQRVV